MPFERSTESRIRQLLNLLPFDEPPEALLKRLEHLHRGLEPETEFAQVLTWLGRCRLVHKLSQEQLPVTSTDEFRVPDLLAIFEYGGRPIPVLIEVKTTDVSDPLSLETRTISLNRKYLAYADLVRLPMLTAWRHRGIWTLFEMQRATLAHVNYKIDFETAMKENLLGILGGDFSYRLVPGTRIRMRIRKLTPTDPISGEFKGEIVSVDYVNSDGETVPDIPHLSSLFTFWENDVELFEDREHVVQSFVIPETGQSEMASRTLGRIVHAFADLDRKSVNWHSLMHDTDHLAHDRGQLRALINLAGQHGIATDVWTFVPHTLPSFLSIHDLRT